MCQLPYKESVVLQWRNVAPLNNMQDQFEKLNLSTSWLKMTEPHIWVEIRSQVIVLIVQNPKMVKKGEFQCISWYKT